MTAYLFLQHGSFILTSAQPSTLTLPFVKIERGVFRWRWGRGFVELLCEFLRHAVVF